MYVSLFISSRLLCSFVFVTIGLRYGLTSIVKRELAR